MSKNVGQLNVKLTADTKEFNNSMNSAINKMEEAKEKTEDIDSVSLNNLKQTVDNIKDSFARMSLKQLQKELADTKLDLEFKQSFAQALSGTGTGDLQQAELNETVEKYKQLQQLINNFDNTKLVDIKEETSSINKNLTNMIGGAQKFGNKFKSSLKKNFHSLKRFTFGLMGARAGLSYLIQSARQYISYNDELKSKTLGVSQALSQALAPYMTIAINLMQSLVHWVILAIGYFTTFINALFGTKLAIGGIGNSFKDLGKEAKKNQKLLAPFDDFHILDEGNNTPAPNFEGLGINTDEIAQIDTFKLKMEEFSQSPFWKIIKDNWKDIIGLILLITITIAALVGAWVVVIAAFVGYLLLYKDEIINAIKIAVDIIWDVIKTLFNFIRDALIVFVGIVAGIVGSILQLIGTIVNTIIDVVKTALNIILSVVKLIIVDGIGGALKLMFNNIKIVVFTIRDIFKTIFGGIKDFIVKLIHGDIAGAFTSLKDTFLSVLKIIWNSVKNIFGNIWNYISGIAKGIGNVFIGAIRGMVNSIINFAEKTINGFIKAINLAINVINAIPGVKLSNLKLLNIPRLATGGVLNSPAVVEVGEYSGAKANPEIVSPRDMMYETMIDALKSQRINNKNEVEMTINVKYEDGRQIIRKINATQDEAGKTLLEV